MVVNGRHALFSALAKNNASSAPWKFASKEVCYVRRSLSRGIWFEENPLDFEFPVMMLQIIFVFFVSRFIHWLLRPLKQPKFICNVLAGILIGPSGLGRSKAFYDVMYKPQGSYLVYVMSVIGAIYFIFLTAVKMEVTMILKTARTTWKIALSGFFLPFFTVYLLRYALKMKSNGLGNGVFAFTCASSLSFSYFIVVARALEELNLITSELGQLALSMSIVYDTSYLFIWIGGIAAGQKTPAYSIGFLASIFAFIAFTAYIVRPLILMIIKRTPKGKPVKQIYIAGIFAGVLVMGAISNWIGIPMAHGALLLGLAIPNGPPLGSTLTQKGEVFITEVFLQLVFVFVGSETDIYSVKNWKTFFAFQLIILAAYFAKLLGTFLAALHSNIMLKNAILLSLIMSVRGLIEIFTYRKWLMSEFIDNQTFTQLMLSMVVLTMIVVPIIEVYYKPQMRINQHLSFGKKGFCRSIQELKPNSEFRIISCVHTQDNVRSIITLLESISPAESSPVSTFVIHLVELVGRAVPSLVPHSTQGRSPEDMDSEDSDCIMRAFENFSKNSKGSVTINPFVLIAPQVTMHECICRFALENLVPFVVIPFHENQRLIIENQAAWLRHFNLSLQEFALCTVGILVDRSFGSQLNPKHFSYSAAVIFVGGGDDREALAFATRMSGHSAVKITVYHFITIDSHYEEEKEVDELLMEEFKLKNRRNPRVAVREIIADDREKLVDSLRTIDSNHDLLVVGRRRGNDTMIDEEMSGFVQNPELGVIGDMLASTDICGGEASVLVMQRGDDGDADNGEDESEQALMGSEFQRFKGG